MRQTSIDELATAGERAAGDDFVLHGRRAGDGLQPQPARRSWLRTGLEQRARIGILRLPQHGFDRAAFHDQAGVHDDDPVAMAGDDGKIVADQNERHARFRPEPVDQAKMRACTVTSRAVVGSSAMTRRGPQPIAIAIIAR